MITLTSPLTDTILLLFLLTTSPPPLFLVVFSVLVLQLAHWKHLCGAAPTPELPTWWPGCPPPLLILVAWTLVPCISL